MYTKRHAGDVVKGATLVERINGQKWIVKCECGEMFVGQPSSMSGLCKKCAMKRMGENRTIHGESPDTGKNASRLYSIWLGMRTRCNNPNADSFKFYGERGVKVCDEWSSYISFKNWALSHGYDESLTLDRIDCNGDYSPGNCRWATLIEQGNNKRSNHMITYKGKTQTLAEWSRETGIPYHTLKRRINNSRFTVEEALTLPPKIGNNQWASNYGKV